jgi:hypothetical protein
MLGIDPGGGVKAVNHGQKSVELIFLQQSGYNVEGSRW